MGFDVGIINALLYGIASFLSPCVLPLVPPYLCFLAGMSIDELSAAKTASKAHVKVMISAFAFVAGFIVVFTAIGMSATAFGQTIAEYNDYFRWGAGLLLIVFGLHFMGIFRIGFLYREARVHVERKPPGVFGSFIIGLAFAFGWTPCVGPLLSQILFIAAQRESIGEGAMLLFFYGLGIGIPFLLAAAFAGQFMKFMQKFRRHLGKVEKVMGALLVLSGIGFIFGWFTELAFLFLEYGIGTAG